MVFALRFAGYNAFGASDAEECQKLAKEQRPAIIMIDARLTTAQGCLAYRTLKNDEDTRLIPLMLFVEAGEEIESLHDLDGKETILKPIAPDALTRIVKRYLSSMD